MPDPAALRWQKFDLRPGEDVSPSPFAAAAAGQSVLVTGAGGFIGSALVQAIASAGPARLVLLDSSEQNLFAIHHRLQAAAHVPHEPVLGSVTDPLLLHALLRRVRPQMVYHAAALKHVPLLERNPFAAVLHNAVGTFILAQAAREHSVAALVLVSTDKAVNPSSMMGASKRMAELTVAALSGPHCRMNAIRLGNVIGSTGSAVPIFLDQIARGGPVTVTHPDARRYFMSLGEAVGAILAAGSAGSRGAVLLPELAAPENIADLARFLIGERQIPIRFIGLRPGEKLNEELMSRAETRTGSAGPLQVIATPAPAPEELAERMSAINCMLASANLAGLLDAILALVPEYRPSALILSNGGCL
jgi:FlaA1/EpsC-like NDP-sugar epimerase